MRADRLVAVLLLMQARGRVAEELEISVATARRDLEARPRASRSIHSPGDTAAGS